MTMKENEGIYEKGFYEKKFSVVLKNRFGYIQKKNLSTILTVILTFWNNINSSQ